MFEDRVASRSLKFALILGLNHVADQLVSENFLVFAVEGGGKGEIEVEIVRENV